LARAALPGPSLDAAERRVLGWMGLGSDSLARLSTLAASPQPTLLHGERGTGKERVARMLHRLARRSGAFVERRPGARVELEGAPGTLFLPNAHEHTDMRDVVRHAVELGWAVAAATRSPEPVEGLSWARLTLAPLRERPDDLRALAGHALEAQCRRLGMGRRTFDRAAWALMFAHRWPGNAHELDDFVLAAIEACPGPVIRGARMPEALRALLAPRSTTGEALESFEEMARTRLTPVVRDYVAGPGPTLHDIVVDAAERALFALAMARTGGNRKQAALLLGVSRNTLQWRLERLGISATRG
jgi:DNA-binding NtrC family response regulator